MFAIFAPSADIMDIRKFLKKKRKVSQNVPTRQVLFASGNVSSLISVLDRKKTMHNPSRSLLTAD